MAASEFPGKRGKLHDLLRSRLRSHPELLMLHILAKGSYKNSPDSRSRDTTSWWEELESHTVKWYIYRDVRLGGHYPIGEYKCWAHSPWALRDGRNHWGEKNMSFWVDPEKHAYRTNRGMCRTSGRVSTDRVAGWLVVCLDSSECTPGYNG